MPLIRMHADNLDARNTEFDQQPLARPVFLNSVPKSGTHLLRNVMRMFVPVEQHYPAAFIQHPILAQHRKAFDAEAPKLSWGHLLFSDLSAIALKGVRHILLVRDPYDWVIARARFFLSDTFQANLEHLKKDAVSVEDMLNMMIFGIPGKAPTLSEIYTHNAVSWLGTGIHLVRYEELAVHCGDPDTLDAHAYFARLLDAAGVGELPEDWRDRVRVGADRGQSGTARENLAGRSTTFPDTLPDTQKRLVDYAAPGLRALLGYGTGPV
ncbi:hypothetical protein [Maricaulis virginensis]|uniref:Sulfotransferase domain-containing protein n=1 Tax=Maricaulis virginensis TaxID=144022 RepID=A0A9W6MPA9_9PROT|nr:hypothetical protein [Maricaulis virginensis]GLK52766.1 hypothetical protein GCM10017621_22740 [Maricaulis virginensis]